MKRLMILSLIAFAPLTSGCCRGWPRMMMYRGDACDSCATAYETTTPIYEGTVLPAQTLPGPTLPLPGPTEAPAG